MEENLKILEEKLIKFKEKYGEDEVLKNFESEVIEANNYALSYFFAKEFYDSKILANLSIAAPFYLVSVVLLGLAVKPAGLEIIWLIVIPVCYMLFSCVAGITVNLAFPVLKWENEVRIVKQSASMMVTMLIGMLSSITPILVIVFAGEESAELISLLTVIILVCVTWFLYRKNQGKELIKIV